MSWRTPIPDSAYPSLDANFKSRKLLFVSDGVCYAGFVNYCGEYCGVAIDGTMDWSFDEDGFKEYLLKKETVLNSSKVEKYIWLDELLKIPTRTYS